MNLVKREEQKQQLNEVLNTYQVYAMNALGGPAAHWSKEMAKLAGARLSMSVSDMERYGIGKAFAEFRNKELKDSNTSLPYDFKLPQPSVRHLPILMPPDSQQVCEKSETFLEDQRVACFNIGGEKRLCLPQILNTVLKDFSLPIINEACDSLQIYCSRCNFDQLESFKRAGILPSSAPSCGLITKSDSERLCSILLHNSGNHFTAAVHNEQQTDSHKSGDIPVYHECFGEGHGILKIEFYAHPNAKCIECVDCRRMFSTKRFVGHSHNNLENRICHWGFDRNNWRSYLLLDEDRLDKSCQYGQVEMMYNDTLNKFSQTLGQSSNSLQKRRAVSTEEKSDSTQSKVSRRNSDGTNVSPVTSMAAWYASAAARAFPQPIFMSPERYQHKLRSPPIAGCQKEMPTLANPEQVIPHSESSRYEKHFEPNICLQQQSPSKDLGTERKSGSPEQRDIFGDARSPRGDNFSPSVAKSADSTSNDLAPPETPTEAREALKMMETLFLTILEQSSTGGNEKLNYKHRFRACQTIITESITNGHS